MAKEQEQGKKQEEEGDNIPVVTIPGGMRMKSSAGNIFLIIAILIAEAIAAYTVVALYYPELYEWANGAPPGYGAIYEIQDMVINPNETEGMRYLVVSMGVQLNNQGSLEDVQRNEVIIKDAVNTLLSQKTVQQLQDVESRMTLKQEVGVVINSILDDNAVRNVFFTKYVMQ